MISDIEYYNTCNIIHKIFQIVDDSLFEKQLVEEGIIKWLFTMFVGQTLYNNISYEVLRCCPVQIMRAEKHAI